MMAVPRVVLYLAFLFSSRLFLLRIISSFSGFFASASSDEAARSSDTNSTTPTRSTTLRKYLVAYGGQKKEGVYIAMAPAFFGFYGYFGALAGIEDELYRLGDLNDVNNGQNQTSFTSGTSLLVERRIVRGVSGASAGAMAAVVLAAGISPHGASNYVSKIGLADFADPFGLMGVMKGDRFESLMSDFLQSLSPIKANISVDKDADDTKSIQLYSPLYLEDAVIPVAVSTVDMQPRVAAPELFWWQRLLSPWSYISSTYLPRAKILMQGSMARAARASACFPVLFQPVGWITSRNSMHTSSETRKNTDVTSNSSAIGSSVEYSLLIDGGIFDWAGYNGLKEIIGTPLDKSRDNLEDNRVQILENDRIRVVNIAIGGFGTPIPGPEAISKSIGVCVESVLSISIKNLPRCGPWAMKNGPLASSSARMAIRDAMDRPIIASTSTCTDKETDKTNPQTILQSHFVLEIDASSFVE